jgi:hypothetical protein
MISTYTVGLDGIKFKTLPEVVPPSRLRSWGGGCRVGLVGTASFARQSDWAEVSFQVNLRLRVVALEYGWCRPFSTVSSIENAVYLFDRSNQMPAAANCVTYEIVE